jgi:hypothetical protein
VGPSAGLNTEATGKILSPLPGIEHRSPGHPARSQTRNTLTSASAVPSTLIDKVICIRLQDYKLETPKRSINNPRSVGLAVCAIKKADCVFEFCTELLVLSGVYLWGKSIAGDSMTAGLHVCLP